jgi:hypothetical protein
MRAALIGMTTLVAVGCLAGCGSGTTLVESTPRPGPSTEVSPLSPPAGKVDIPLPETEWIPAMIGGARGDALTRALKDMKTLALILPRGSSAAEFEDRVFQMVKAAAPETQVVSRGTATLDALLEERGDIPYRVTMEQSGTDALGRPIFIPKEHPLNTEWLAKKAPLKGAEGMLVVRPIRVRDIRLRELRAGRRGGCDEAIATLKAGLANGAGFFASYEDQVTSLLSKEFSRHLEVALPFWQGELRQAAENAAPGSPASRCIETYLALLDRYAQCRSGNCESGPKLFSEEGGIIGMVDETLLVPNVCPAQGMRDYGVEIDELAERAVHVVLPSLGPGWAGELARLGGLVELARELERGCAPRHRRIDRGDLETARQAVTRYLTDLRDESITAAWEKAGGMARVPGVGGVRILARVKTAADDPSKKASDIARRIRALDRCAEGRERLLQATLVDVGSSEVLFMGIFFEEALLCNGLPPR